MKQDSSIDHLAASLRAQVTRLTPGDRLPSSRTLVERHKVSPVTVSRALGMLAAEGLVVARPGSGTYVADPPRAFSEPPDFGWQAVALGDRTVDTAGLHAMLPTAPEGLIALSGGYLHPSLQPVRALATAASRATRRPASWERPPPSGIAGLRSWFAASAGPWAAGADVLITSGGQAALSIALRSLLAAGSPVLVESPTYPGALVASRAAGLHPVPVPVDAEGVRPDLLAEAFAMTGAKVFYCQPTLHNPTGTVLPAERRAQVLSVARAVGAFVIEDDYARYLGLAEAPPPLAADDDEGTVVHLTSLTKITAPSMRIAAMIARGPVAERLRATQLVDTFFPARPLQETALELVSSPAWPRHLGSVRAALRRRRDVLAAAVARELPGVRPTRPAGGLHLWLRLPPGVDEQALTEAAARAGVMVSAGRPFFPAEPSGHHLRLSYSIAATEAELTEGVRRLAQALSAVS
ncbi:PLP-dependent aminotransferase family protein [Actinomadura scrupuli]|uniref:aminotransferase-like domain-containing protein n=1 Tax=Actinomadura scrupuli TaxID=559629 RepID=UPI003D97E164